MSRNRHSNRSSFKTPEEQLTDAINAKQLSKVVRLLNTNADPNHPDSRGNTAVHTAAAVGHLEILNEVLGKMARVNAKNGLWQTGLHKACVGGKYDCAKALVKRGADVDAVTQLGQTALMFAALGTGTIYTEIVIILMDAKANPNVRRRDGRTALAIAASRGSLNTVKYLAKRGADVNIPDTLGITALMRSAQNCEYLMVSWLVRLGADPKLVTGDGKTVMDLPITQARAPVRDIRDPVARMVMHKDLLGKAIAKGIRQATAIAEGRAIVNSDDEREREEAEKRLSELRRKSNAVSAARLRVQKANQARYEAKERARQKRLDENRKKRMEIILAEKEKEKAAQAQEGKTSSA